MTTATTTKAPRTRRNIRGTYCGEGAVRQDGDLPIYDCLTCGAEVVWATSRKTGRKYLVNVSVGESGRRFYMKQNVHRCADKLALDAEYQASIDRDRASQTIADYEDTYEWLVAEYPRAKVLGYIAHIMRSEPLAAAWDTYYGGKP